MEVPRRVMFEIQDIDSVLNFYRFDYAQSNQSCQSLSVRRALIVSLCGAREQNKIAYLPQCYALISSMSDLEVVLYRLDHICLATG